MGLYKNVNFQSFKSFFSPVTLVYTYINVWLKKKITTGTAY